MNKYIKIQKIEDGDVLVEYFEPLSIENIGVALETELLEDAEVGQQVILTVVEMTQEEYEAIADSEGY